MLKRYCHILILVLLGACIDPFDVGLPIYQRQLVVDGTVMEGPGPHKVRLFFSSNLESRNEFVSNEPMNNAQVRILVDDDAIFILNQTSAGVYETAVGDLIAEVGKTYQLIIQSNEQQFYESTPQKLEASGEIENIYYEFSRDHFYNASTKQFQSAVLIYIDAKTDPQSSGLIRWRYDATYEIITQPELRTMVLPISATRVPDPVPCSGYSANVDATTNPASILQTQYGPIFRVDDCTCCTCWVKENNGMVNLAKNQFIQNNTYNKVLIASIPVDRWRFYKKYAIEVEQLSVTEEVYEFWKRVEAQQQGANSLFQPNAIVIKGNVINTTNPKEQVLGIFNVSASDKRILQIEKSEIPLLIRDPDLFFDDCSRFDSRSSTTKPEFW